MFFAHKVELRKEKNKKYEDKVVDGETADHVSKEVKMDRKFVEDIILREGYQKIGRGVSIGPISDEGFLRSVFSCHYKLEKFNEVTNSKRHLVTGFGPTNAPTGGTLSMILRALYFEKETGIDSTIVISNLGAFNSRNIDLGKLEYFTGRFMGFIRALGYKGELRPHNDFELLVASNLTSKVLTTRDFLENKEVTADLYKRLGIQGEDFPTFVDANLTVADILLPAILKRKERILVFVGIEEYYFPKLANIVLRRFDERYGDTFVHPKTSVSSVFGHLIGGLNGFPKMSKSIPESSINLDDSYTEIKTKILECRSEDEKIIFQMMNLVSEWGPKQIAEAESAFLSGGTAWMRAKKDYLGYFLGLKKMWEATAAQDYRFNLDSLFKQRCD